MCLYRFLLSVSVDFFSTWLHNELLQEEFSSSAKKNFFNSPISQSSKKAEFGSSNENRFDRSIDFLNFFLPLYIWNVNCTRLFRMCRRFKSNCPVLFHFFLCFSLFVCPKFETASLWHSQHTRVEAAPTDWGAISSHRKKGNLFPDCDRLKWTVRISNTMNHSAPFLWAKGPRKIFSGSSVERVPKSNRKFKKHNRVT